MWGSFTSWTVKKHFWQRLLLGFIALILFLITGMYGIARWYMHKHQNERLTVGATFIPDYARYFDLNPKETLTAMLDDLEFKKVRLVSYWSNIEHTRGTYDFSELDWQMEMAKSRGTRVALAIGLRQPRWPECHMPDWAQAEPITEWQPQLQQFIAAVVERYKDNPALDSYQLENEYFLSVFGECPNFDRDRLVSEYNLVKGIDPNHTLVVSMSNNAIGTPIGKPTPDEWAISVYKRVWDKTITQRYFEYPIPAWYYGFRAGWVELTRGRDSFIHELQTEPWIADPGGGRKDESRTEQDKKLDAIRRKDRIKYGEATGMREVDMWGVEWWYWRKVKFNDPSLWNVAKTALKEANDHNEKLRSEDKLKINTDIIKK
ncbi:hypothetical protein BH10PAT3_BH10PAT3_2230 [soil metagenome]